MCNCCDAYTTPIIFVSYMEMMMMNHYAADDLTLSTTSTSHSITSTSASNNKLVCRIGNKGMKKKKLESAPKITRPCTECGRKFWSWKALFGHMRCHPERHWRGINPPPNHLRSEEYDAAASLLMLANGPPAPNGLIHSCSSCNKVFATHQALGGHRASHRNVKGCFAINLPADEPMMIHEEEGYNHKCSICFRVFSSGQALGGHMRCHNSTAAIPPGHFDFNAADPHPHPHPHHLDNLDLDLRLGAL